MWFCSLVVAPTGAGKTGIIALLPYVLASSKVMILSPSLIITHQLEKAFGLRNDVATESFFFEKGMVIESELNDFLEMGKKIEKTESISNMEKYNLVIVNAQKFGGNSTASLKPRDEDDTDTEAVAACIQLSKIKENFASFTTLIVDEAHHYPAETWDLIYEEFRGKQIIFLTATPFRGSDRKELWADQKITFQISRKELVDRKIIRPISYHDIPCGMLGEILYDQIEKYIYATLLKHDEKEPSIKHKAMVLTWNKDDAECGARNIKEATLYTSDKKTERNLKPFEESKFRVLFVCGRLLEGM